MKPLLASIHIHTVHTFQHAFINMSIVLLSSIRIHTVHTLQHALIKMSIVARRAQQHQLTSSVSCSHYFHPFVHTFQHAFINMSTLARRAQQHISSRRLCRVGASLLQRCVIPVLCACMYVCMWVYVDVCLYVCMVYCNTT